MRDSKKLVRFLLAWLALALSATAQAQPWNGIAGTPDATIQAPAYQISGTIELIPGHPATSAFIASGGRVLVLDAPRGALVQADSSFSIRSIDPFSGCVRIQAEVVVAGTNERIVREARACAVGQFEYREDLSDATDFGIAMPPVVMTRPVTVTGTFPGITATVANDVYVAIDSLGVAVPVSTSGTFIIPGVPPGLHQIELRPFNPSSTTIRGTSWMRAAVLSGLQSNHIGPTVTISRTAIAPSPGTTAPLTGTAILK